MESTALATTELTPAGPEPSPGAAPAADGLRSEPSAAGPERGSESGREPGPEPRREPGPEPGSDSGRKPFDADLAEDLGDEIATLAAHIHAATHRLLTLLARFDRLGGWEPGGHRSCAHWLAFRTGFDLGTAREHLRVARALERLPRTGAAMARGALSFSQVRALTRVADAETEADLLELAEGCTTAQLESLVRAWKRGSRHDEAAWERERHRSRTFSVFPDDEGMYVVRGRLDPEVGAVLMRAVEAASDALYHERRRAGVSLEAGAGAGGARAELACGGAGADCAAGEGHRDGASRATPRAAARLPAAGAYDLGVDTPREAARRRADAVGLLAERALAAGFGPRGDAAPTGAPTSERPPSGTPAPLSGTRAERYQVVLHVDRDTLAEDGEPGRSELEDGTRVSAETSRRLSCDAALVRVEHRARGGDGQGDRNRNGTRGSAGGSGPGPGGGVVGGWPGSVLDVGRRTRTIPPALRRALEARDRGCRFPSCGLRLTEAHHVEHWADGGETSLRNTLLLCRYHHRLVHEDGWRVEWWGTGRPAFRDPRGTVHMARRRSRTQLPDRPIEALARENRLAAAKIGEWVEPDGWTAGARWTREADIPDDLFFRAMEAAM